MYGILYPRGLNYHKAHGWDKVLIVQYRYHVIWKGNIYRFHGLIWFSFLRPAVQPLNMHLEHKSKLLWWAIALKHPHTTVFVWYFQYQWLITAPAVLTTRCLSIRLIFVDADDFVYNSKARNKYFLSTNRRTFLFDRLWWNPITHAVWNSSWAIQIRNNRHSSQVLARYP